MTFSTPVLMCCVRRCQGMSYGQRIQERMERGWLLTALHLVQAAKDPMLTGTPCILTTALCA